MDKNLEIIKKIDYTNTELYKRRNYSGISTKDLIKKAIENNTLAKSIEYFDGLAEGLRILGIFYCYEGDAEQALQTIRRAENICNSFSVDQKILANIYNAYIYLYAEVIKDYNLSAQYSQKGLELARKLNMPHLVAKITMNYGAICNSVKMYEEALESLLTSLKYGKMANDEFIVMYSYENLGEAYYYLEDYCNSKRYFNLALEKEKEVEDQIINAECKKWLGLISYKRGKVDEAIEVLENVKEYVREIQLRQIEVNVSFVLFQLYLENDKYKEIPHLIDGLFELINDFDSNIFYADYYKFMSKYHYNLENYKKAYIQKEQYVSYLKKVHTNQESKDISAVRSESMQRQLEQLQLLSEIGRDINTMESIEEIFDAIYDYLDRFFEEYNLLLGILEKDCIHYVYNKNRKTRIEPYRRELDNKNSLASWAIKNDKMIIMNDLENEFSIYIENLVVYGDPNVPQSIIVVPLKVNDKIIGVMNFQTLKKDMLTIERVEMFRIISSYAAIAVKNSLYSKELENLSNKDQLTDLYNWRYYDRKLKEILDMDYKNFTLFVLDIDHFKNINDSFGHSVGNLCLKKLADLSKEHFEDSEFIARIGGEEFAIGYINETRQDIMKLGKEFIKKVKREMAKVRTYNVNLTISIGAAFYKNTKELTSDDIFKTADSALYKAKDSGRNNVQFIYKD